MNKPITQSEFKAFQQQGMETQYYDGKPGEYFCFCMMCKKNFAGDKRDPICPTCRGGQFVNGEVVPFTTTPANGAANR